MVAADLWMVVLTGSSEIDRVIMIISVIDSTVVSFFCHLAGDVLVVILSFIMSCKIHYVAGPG